MKYVQPLVIAVIVLASTNLLQGQSFTRNNPHARFSLSPRVEAPGFANVRNDPPTAEDLSASGPLSLLDEDPNGLLFPDDSLRKQASTVPVPFEGYDPARTQVQWGRVAIIGTALAATVAAIHVYQSNSWWKDNRCDFHIIDDDEYALNVDKVGHFYGGALASFIGQKSMEWSGFSRPASVWGGFAIGALFELYVEFEDGFACDWGFSRGDAYADIAGAAWPVLQYYAPIMQNFQPKYSYWPSEEYKNGIHPGNAIDDYNGQTYWMGVHVHGLLPKTWQDYWPSWLGFAVGVGVRNVRAAEPLERHIYISLDYDFTKILPGDSWFLYTLKQALNFIHFPAPAIRISPSGVFYVLYF